jgi:hypothetical protein
MLKEAKRQIELLEAELRGYRVLERVIFGERHPTDFAKRLDDAIETQSSFDRFMAEFVLWPMRKSEPAADRRAEPATAPQPEPVGDRRAEPVGTPMPAQAYPIGTQGNVPMAAAAPAMPDTFGIWSQQTPTTEPTPQPGTGGSIPERINRVAMALVS